MKEQELFSLIGFLRVSKHRQKILKCLGEEYLLPSEIASKTKMGVTQVSNVLSDLKRKKLVRCVNEQDIKGRIYMITDIGLEVLNHLK